jgi:leucyl/phenylalanyl-tRNA---protein transferase
MKMLRSKSPISSIRKKLLAEPQPLDPDILLRAYAQGIFPMADGRDAPEVYWVEPKRRGVLPLDGFHLSGSLAKTLRSDRFETTADRAFGDVVRLCAEAATDRPSTWINDQIEAAVAVLHQRGNAHSIETWRDGSLVGGLYGVRLGRAFFGESMFSRATDASKVALAHLIARMRVGGFTLLDCQFLTPHLATLGAIEVSRADYLVSLKAAVSDQMEGDWLGLDRLADDAAGASPPRTTTVSGPISGWRILHSLVQTS